MSSNAIFNSAVFAGSEIEITDSTVVFSEKFFSAVSQPTINVGFGGKFFDFDFEADGGVLSGDVSN